MRWTLSPRIHLKNGRIPDADARRQARTAGEILTRLERQPGLILADEVGMGKTYVALAVAVSVVEATGGSRPVVIQVPSSVREKWPREWDVMQQYCLDRGAEIRATSTTVGDSTSFLKRLDDPPDRRDHIIFMTHNALNGSLGDPFVQLAIISRVLHRSSLAAQRGVFPRWASDVVHRRFRDENAVAQLLNDSPIHWRATWKNATGEELKDDPVPAGLVEVLDSVDLQELENALSRTPLRFSKHVDSYLDDMRREVRRALRSLWKTYLKRVNLSLPLLIMDEAHHLKNPYTRLAGVYANPDVDAPSDDVLERGALGGVFDRMLFLTATPFQLGHRELIEILSRFESIRWGSDLDRGAFRKEIEELDRRLTGAQSAAVRLDRAWGRLRPADVASFSNRSWWMEPDAPDLPEKLRQTARHFGEVAALFKEANAALRPWVIRHVRPDRDARRVQLCGRAIQTDDPAERRGLEVDESAVLPFLLAARARSVAATGSAEEGAYRAYFSEGISSSYEAYRDTRRPDTTGVEVPEHSAGIDDLPSAAEPPASSELTWYLEQLDVTLPDQSRDSWGAHPKIASTVDRTTKLWSAGEKVTIFCFYRATGRSLRRHISRSLRMEIVQRGAAQLGLNPGDVEGVERELQLRADRFFDVDSPARLSASKAAAEVLEGCGLKGVALGRAVDVVIRFLRTPSFQVRFLDLASNDLAESVRLAFGSTEADGPRLRSQVESFGRFVAGRVDSERDELLDALKQVQTGRFFGRSEGPLDEDVEDLDGRELLLPNVRLANGSTKAERRRHLMLAFNTPFFPEVLIASSVMAEGVDLHLNCSHIIHHDLDWNPSVLEQRTGRLDRIGSKAELAGRPIRVYEPFLEATQDEKLFRVVKDRERWFSVVMGQELRLDEFSSEKLAERVALPPEAAAALSMRLDVDAVVTGTGPE